MKSEICKKYNISEKLIEIMIKISLELGYNEKESYELIKEFYILHH